MQVICVTVFVLAVVHFSSSWYVGILAWIDATTYQEWASSYLTFYLLGFLLPRYVPAFVFMRVMWTRSEVNRKTSLEIADGESEDEDDDEYDEEANPMQSDRSSSRGSG